MSSESDKLDSNPGNGPDADSVAAWLDAHPDFFEGRDELLKKLHIPHDSGKAISLLEHQVNLLRADHREQEEQIENLMQHASANDTLFEKTRIVILALLKAENLEALSEILSREMQAQFSTTENHLVFIGGDLESDVAALAGLNTRGHGEAVNVLGAFFEKKRTFCGQLDASQAAFFFPEHEQDIASVAIVPVHLHSAHASKPLTPVLVLGSTDADYFHSSQDTLFLDFIGEVLASLIDRFLD